MNVQIDFDGLQQRIVHVQACRSVNIRMLRAGVAGTVFYLEAMRSRRWQAGRQRWRFLIRIASAIAARS